jgi:periplasmic divalent cation tolerance protein
MILCTAPPLGAEKMARALVLERLAACVNVALVRSYFSWEGKLSDEPEELMIIKTQAQMVDKIKARIKEMHSYQVPEIIVIPIVGGERCYLEWVSHSVG